MAKAVLAYAVSVFIGGFVKFGEDILIVCQPEMLYGHDASVINRAQKTHFALAQRQQKNSSSVAPA